MLKYVYQGRVNSFAYKRGYMKGGQFPPLSEQG